ncbi:MAG TPA: cellulase family glycosylhydrolase, partial [Bdellovibrio sp.]|nr:cellulase family glycosylhydrolase [Bdellovibrio sp.]
MSGSNFFPKMKHIGLALMGLTLVFSGNGYADICGSPRPNRLKVTPDVSSFGYSAHLSTMTDNDYVMMKQAGVGFMRFDMNWDYLEKTPGVYDFSSTDSAIGKMLANGIRPLAVLDYGNHNYTTGGLTTDAWRAHFAAFAGAAAAHYAYLGQNGGKGMMFEIWNEPNGSQFWVPYPGAAALTPNGADYAALLHAASVAIHTADPNAAVIGPALSMLVVTPWVTTFLSQKFLDHNKISQSILADMDAFSVHPYRFGKNAPPESAIYSYNQLRIAMENASGPCQRQLPIVSSEWGYSATPTLPWALNADQQAAYQIRSWFVNLTLGVIP